jgi:predicted acetyltransferase
MSNLQLRPLTIEDERSFRHAVSEFENETPPWKFAFDFDPQEDFASYVTKVNGWPLGISSKDNFVSNSFLVGIVDGRVVGRLSLRHTLNGFLKKYAGHIG